MNQAYIVRTPGPFASTFEMWNRNTKTWQWFFDGSNKPYASVSNAGRQLGEMQRKGIIPTRYVEDPIGEEYSAMSIDAMAKRWPHRFH